MITTRSAALAGSLCFGLGLAAGPAAAKNFQFSGTIIACTPTCDSFDFQDAGSEFSGYITIDNTAVDSGSWDGGDITDYSFTVLNPALPPLASDPPDPTIDNPYVLDASTDGGGVEVANGQMITNPRGTFPSAISAGTTDGETITSGFIDFWVTEGLLANNGAIITLNFTDNCVGDALLDEPAPCFEVNIFEGLVFVSGGNLVVPDLTTFEFEGIVEDCTATCDSFAFLDFGSTLSGFVDVNVDTGDFQGSAVGDLSFAVENPALPPFGPSDPPDPLVDNPFNLDETVNGGGVVVANGQDITNPRGTFTSNQSMASTDGTTITAGFLDFWLTQGDLANNGAVITLRFDADCNDDLGNWTATAPCFEVRIFEGLIFVAGGSLSVPVDDTDGDGVTDDIDNCTTFANASQTDTDGDFFGNACDPDHNQDCSVNFVDLGLFKAEFGGSSAGFDYNEDTFVNFVDLGRLKQLFFSGLEAGPGPSGLPNVCD